MTKEIGYRYLKVVVGSKGVPVPVAKVAVLELKLRSCNLSFQFFQFYYLSIDYSGPDSIAVKLVIAMQ